MLQSRFAAVCLVLLSLHGCVAFAQQGPAENFVSSTPEPVDFHTESYGSSSSSAVTMSKSSSADGMIRIAPSTPVDRGLPSTRPFHSLAIGLIANTLGAGVEIATPLSRSFSLRSGFNFLSFAYPLSHDGVDYDAKFHLQSTVSTLDWFPGHRSFHISPGILYSNNYLGAAVSVKPGQYFELGDQGFLNSIDDPVSGNAAVVFPRKVAPMLMIGFGNIIPRSGRHLSVPFEIGVAYTGAPTINVNLIGTACTPAGCVNFASNPDAQSSLRQEIGNINEELKRIPVYPIASLGLAYRF